MQPWNLFLLCRSVRLAAIGGFLILLGATGAAETVFWREKITGDNAVWIYQQNTIVKTADSLTQWLAADSVWEMVASGDFGNEQNTQFESSCVVLNGRVIVAYVDSNQGVYGLGTSTLLPNRIPRFAGYSVLHPGAALFEDKGNPPVSTLGTPGDTTDDGDAGDPVLAVDQSSQFVYMVGTSIRRAGGWKGIPLWKSTDGGVTFGTPTTVHSEISTTDKPWITVDNATGTGQHDLYLTFISLVGSFQRAWLTVSTDNGANWNTLQQIQVDGTSRQIQSPIPVVGPDHVAYVFWFEQLQSSDGVNYPNYLKIRKVQNRGTSLGTIYTIRQLVTTDETVGNLKLKRSDGAANGDTFRAFPFPVPAVNPSASKANHLYVAYADKGENPGDNADVFFLRSTDGGATWDNGTTGITTPKRVNSVASNDQWMPVLAVKPDGTKLFVAWYDRRKDSNNSLIDVYGRWGTIAADGTVTFATEFRITTQSFPPVFAGTLGSPYTSPGYYDPVYPPKDVNLHWWYPEWPLVDAFGDPVLTSDAYIGHVGEYNGAWVDGSYVYLTWTDYRRLSAGTLFNRNQGDIRFGRLTWPQ